MARGTRQAARQTPIADNKDAAGRKANRRVEFQLDEPCPAAVEDPRPPAEHDRR